MVPARQLTSQAQTLRAMKLSFISPGWHRRSEASFLIIAAIIMKYGGRELIYAGVADRRCTTMILKRLRNLTVSPAPDVRVYIHA